MFIKVYDSFAGKHLEHVFGKTKLGIETIPFIDDPLEKIGKHSPLGFEFGSSIGSTYIWRGQKLSNRACTMPHSVRRHRTYRDKASRDKDSPSDILTQNIFFGGVGCTVSF